MTLTECINTVAHSVAVYVCESSTLDMKGLEFEIRMQLELNLERALRDEIRQIADEIQELNQMIASCSNPCQRARLQTKVSKLSAKRKSMVRSVNTDNTAKEYDALKRFVKDRYGDDALDEFFLIVGPKEKF